MAKQGLLHRFLREPPPHGVLASQPGYPWLVVATVCVGAFIGQLDASIVSVAIPTLEVSFHSSLAAVQWVAIAYLLVLTALLTPLGHLADAVGRKSMYTVGFVVFGAGSALCALSPGIPTLIGARALQGIGAAMLQANSVAIIAAAVERRRLGRAIGMQGTAQAVGLAVGPTVSGALIAWLGWRWVFLINVPIALAGTVLARLILPVTPKAHSMAPRVRDAILLPGAVALALLGLTFLGDAWVLLPAAAALMVCYIVTERTNPRPLLGREVLDAPGLLAGAIAALLSYTILFGVMLAVPLLLERAFGQSAAQAGLTLTTIPVALAVVAQIGGSWSDRVGPRLPTVGGMSAVVLGLSLLAWGAGGRLDVLVPALALVGVGMGLFIPPNNASIMSAAPPMHLGVTGGLINTMRGIGASLGIALVSLTLHIGVGPTVGTAVTAAMVVHGIRLSLLGLIAAGVCALLLSARRISAGH